jgi:1-acyl-sn-glycerol-3-phosphate acyltransferase
VTAGYYRHEAATAAIRTSDGWTRSGDRGYLADGQVHVTGRLKDIIIKGGRNIYPQEVEDLAGSVPGVRQGCVAAFGDRHETGGTERLIVVAETRETNEAERERIRHGVVDRVAAALGVPPDLVVLAYPGAVLKTSSGKIRRSATRELYVRGDLEHGPRSTARQWTALVGRAARGRARRVADVGGRTLYTAWIGAWLALSVPLLLAGAVSARSPLGARRWLRRWAGFLLGIGGVSPRVDAWEQVPAHGPCVYLANHASYIDAAVMLAVLPADTVFAVKAGLVEYPVLGTVIRRCDYVRMHRGAHDDRLDSANETIARLRQGATLFVFPEGTFIRAPGLLPFRLGAFRAAAEAGVPVVPLALDGTRTVLPDGTWLARRAPIVVTASAPLSARGTDWASLVRLRDEAQAAIASRTSEGRGVGDPETQLFSEFD